MAVPRSPHLQRHHYPLHPPYTLNNRATMPHIFRCSLAVALALVTACIAAPSPTLLFSRQDLAGSSAVLGPAATAGDADPGDLSGVNVAGDVPVASSQALPQQSVQLGSETDIVPVTGVYPQVVYQPAIQIYDPDVSDFQTYGGRGGVYGGCSNGMYGGSVGGLGNDAVDMGDLAPSGVVGPDGGLYKRQLGPLGGGIVGGPAGPLGVGAAGFGGPGGPGAGGPPSSIVGALSGISTNTVIQPIVSIQPHAYQPVPILVSQPYNYPVPVGVSVPAFPFGRSCRRGRHGFGFGDDFDCGFDDDCDANCDDDCDDDCDDGCDDDW